jgi:putative ABC transport system ATP-binding protein
VFQTFNLIPSMTAEENVSLPMILAGRLSRAAIRARATELLSRVGLSARRDHLPSQLSGGEQQRVTIARALANRPAILLLDEPTGNIDTLNSTLVLSLLVELNRTERITCIMVTHDAALKDFAHRIVRMVDGKVARIETVDAETRQSCDDDLHAKAAIIRGEQSGAIKHTPEPVTEYREAQHYGDGFIADESDED